MKPRLTPIHVNLKDLPAEGREFTYSRTSEELNDSLADLLGSNEYSVSFRLTPMGNAFDLKGQLKTHLDLQCALCAMDFRFPVELKLHELLVVQKPLNKGEQLGKTNHAHEWENQGPDYILLESEVFQVADYIHEAIALSEPIRPLGKPDCDLSCENLTEPMKKWLLSDAKPVEAIKANPFQVLEKIKLKS